MTFNTVRVVVGAAEIQAGRRGDCWGCPVALAIQAAAAGVHSVHVGTTAASWWSGDWATYVAALPPAAVVFIERFDDNVPVEPFAFDLAYIPGISSTKAVRTGLCDSAKGGA